MSETQMSNTSGAYRPAQPKEIKHAQLAKPINKECGRIQHSAPNMKAGYKNDAATYMSTLKQNTLTKNSSYFNPYSNGDGSYTYDSPDQPTI